MGRCVNEELLIEKMTRLRGCSCSYSDGIIDEIEDIMSDLPTADVIPLAKVKQAREQIIDEKDFAYSDFDMYKEEVLNVESDELPDDDFRYGMERCLQILDKMIAESEELYEKLVWTRFYIYFYNK